MKKSRTYWKSETIHQGQPCHTEKGKPGEQSSQDKERLVFCLRLNIPNHCANARAGTHAGCMQIIAWGSGSHKMAQDKGSNPRKGHQYALEH